MSGVWFAGLMKPQPMPITSSTIDTLTTTMMLLTKADSCVPRISSAVSSARMNTAGRFMRPLTPSGDSLERRVGPLVWYSRPEPGEDAIGVFTPRDRDRRRADRILEHQVPADDPGDQLAHRRVGVGVGAAGDGDHRGELGVTETGERAADAGDDEREDDRRARAIGDRGRRAHEQAGADDRADPQRHERERTQRPPERAFPGRAGLGHQLVDGFGPEQ